VLWQLVLAPFSKLDSLRVREGTGSACRRTGPCCGAHTTVRRRHNAAAGGRLRDARGAGPQPALILYDVSTLYPETAAGDGFHESRFSKERRLNPQVNSACSPTRRDSPLMVSTIRVWFRSSG
jgi:hypothetical protein